MGVGEYLDFCWLVYGGSCGTIPSRSEFVYANGENDY
jgi:hypothetical protein